MNVVCKSCPIGCHLNLVDGKIVGNRCSRGLSYGKDILAGDEKTYFSTRIRIKNAPVGHLPIISDIKVSDEQKEELQKIISNMEITAPVETGEFVINNLLDTGVSFIAQRRVRKL